MKNVLFLLIDCLRADRCKKGGMAEPYTAPFIRFLGQKGTSFTQAISVTSFTTPSVASMLTGVYPFAHGMEWFSGNKLNPRLRTLPEILKKAGYHTCAMVTGPLSLARLGLDRGFDEYIYRRENESIYSGLEHTLKHYIDNTNRPWFLFVHLWELHYPICLPGDFRTRYQFSKYKYDKAFSCLNHQLMKIFSEFNLDENIIVLTGDHGERLAGGIESIQGTILTIIPHILGVPAHEARRFVWTIFREIEKTGTWGLVRLQKKRGHGFDLSEALIRVPLFFAGNGFGKNRVVDVLVSQVDILPTILDSLGMLNHFSEKIHGVSLLKDGSPRERVIYIGPAGFRATDPRSKTYWIEGLRTPRWKYISRFNEDVPFALYNLEVDSEERENLAKRRTDIIERFRQEMKRIRADRALFPLRMTVGDDEYFARRLKELGYL